MTLLDTLLLFLTAIHMTQQECICQQENSNNPLTTSSHQLKCSNISTESLLYGLQEVYVKWQEDYARTNISLEITDSVFPSIYNFLLPSSSLSQLKLRNLSIAFINDNAFKEHYVLRNLILSDNKLEDISFVRTLPESLEELDLSGNSFEIVTDVFKHLSKLFYLDLSDCRVRNIVHPNIFNLVRVLKINNNKLQALNLYFDQVQREGDILIDLSCNQIRRVDIILPNSNSSVRIMPSLKLSFNRIKKLEDITLSPKNIAWKLIDLSFNSFDTFNKLGETEIEHLNLSNSGINNVINLNLLLINFRGIKSLDLSSNNITFQFPNYFADFITLNNLYLVSSSMTDFGANSFNGLIIKYTLNISHNFIKTLKNNSFNKTQIQILDMSSCNLQRMENNAFYNSKFSVVILKNNKITFLDKLMFKPLSTVEILDLSFNNLKKLNNELFSHCPLLKTVILSNSKLEVIRNRTFVGAESLTTLDLSNNFLTDLTLETSNSLYIANLRNNSITNFHAHVFKYAKVKKLVLTGNKVYTLEDEIFHYDNEFVEIDLSESSVYLIKRKAFDGLRLLEMLNLRKNHIGVISSNTFGQLLNLKKLDLGENNIISFSPSAFVHGNRLNSLRISFEGVVRSKSFINLNNLRHLNITDSNSIVVESDCFKGLIYLKQIDLYNSSVAGVQSGAFSGLSSLENINWRTFLQNIQNLKAGMFQGLLNIKHMDLSFLNISTVEQESFKTLSKLKTLLLDNNQIEQILDQTFIDLNSLNILNLSFNSIFKLEGNSFSGLENLSELLLNNNALYNISLGTFQKIPKLLQLNLRGNFLNKLLTGTFSNLYSLRTLDLSYNNVSSLLVETFFPLHNLHYLDLANNHLIEISFELVRKSLNRLQYIGLNNNKWRCSHLRSMLIDFKNHGIQWKPEKDAVFESENVDGIACVDVCKFLYCDRDHNAE